MDHFVLTLFLLGICRLKVYRHEILASSLASYICSHAVVCSTVDINYVM